MERQTGEAEVRGEPSSAADVNASDAAARTSYEAVPYSVNAFPQTHPDRLATIARLFGLDAPHPEQCRVLELGCASGGNLIPMGLGAPQSRFVGIDLSGRQVADGQAVVRQLGLSNVDLREMSILDVTRELGEFDYILVHGVYSWVPADVQEKILAICQQNLSPRGVAYISYNTYPGWHARAALREMLWYHTARFPDPTDRVKQARALLAFLATSMPKTDGSYGALVRQELMLLLVTPDSYLLHEHLDEVNEPIYFHQFAQRAAAAGLQYLGEAQIGMMAPGRFGPRTEQTLRAIAADLLHMEQYMDFLRNRMFRQTLLCHAEVKLDHALRAETVIGLHVASAAKAQTTEDGDGVREFVGPGKQKLSTRDPLMQSAMTILADAWPRAISFEELFDAACEGAGGDEAGQEHQRRDLATRLLNCAISQLAELSIMPSKFVVTVSQKPLASPYARLRARDGGKVTNMRLETVPMTDAARRLLPLLDGAHDRMQLAEITNESQDSLGQQLESFARSALLIG